MHEHPGQAATYSGYRRIYLSLNDTFISFVIFCRVGITNEKLGNSKSFMVCVLLSKLLAKPHDILPCLLASQPVCKRSRCTHLIKQWTNNLFVDFQPKCFRQIM